MFVGRDWTLVTRDLRTLIYLLNLELREECSRTLGPGAGHGPVCNRGAAAEADAIGRAAAEAGTIGEQQLEAQANGEQQCHNRGAAAGGGGKRGAAVPQSGPGAAAEAHASGEQHAAEADAIGEKQCLCLTEVGCSWGGTGL